MIIGFNLDKINVTKNKRIEGNVEARNNVKIMGITERNVAGFSQKGSGLDIQFSFEVKYGQDLANILFEGKALFMTDKAGKNTIITTWKKEKKVDPKISQPILNDILQRCNIKALSLASEVGLPPHIPFPRLALKSEVDDGRKKAA